jgi:hypothetical protein
MHDLDPTGDQHMTTESIDLDAHRSDVAQRATEIRRRLKDVQLDQEALAQHQREFEAFIVAGPAPTWPEAAAKAQYLIQLLADTFSIHNSRRRQLIDNVFEDFARLTQEAASPHKPSSPNT